MDNLSPAQIGTIISHGVIAVFGGIVHALNAHRNGETKGWGDIALLSIISSFSGIIFALIAAYFFTNEYITLASAGCGGFLGIEGLSSVAKRVRLLITNKI